MLAKNTTMKEMDRKEFGIAEVANLLSKVVAGNNTGSKLRRSVVWTTSPVQKATVLFLQDNLKYRLRWSI